MTITFLFRIMRCGPTPPRPEQLRGRSDLLRGPLMPRRLYARSMHIYESPDIYLQSRVIKFGGPSSALFAALFDTAIPNLCPSIRRINRPPFDGLASFCLRLDLVPEHPLYSLDYERFKRETISNIIQGVSEQLLNRFTIIIRSFSDGIWLGIFFLAHIFIVVLKCISRISSEAFLCFKFFVKFFFKVLNFRIFTFLENFKSL